MKKLIILLFLLPLLVQAQYHNFPVSKLIVKDAADVSNYVQIGVTNYVMIDTANTITLGGDATVWNDLFFPFTTGNAGSALYPPLVLDSLYYGFVIDSTGPTKCFEYFIIQMPHWWKENSHIYPHIHFKYETGNGTPTFKMKYKWYNINVVITPIGWNWLTIATVSATTDKTHQYVTNATGISGSGKTISSILICEIYLTATTNTNKVCNAYQFDIHIEQDALGSTTEWVK